MPCTWPKSSRWRSIAKAQPESRPYPESARTQQREAEVFHSMKRAGLGLAALAAGGALLWELSKRR